MDLPGEKLVIKMWGTLCEKGVGGLLEPWQIKRVGRALTEVRGHEIRMLAQAENDAADIRAGRKQLRKDGTIFLTSDAGPVVQLAMQDPDQRIEPTLGLSNAVRKTEVTAVLDMARSEINVAKAILHAEKQLLNDIQAPVDKEIDEDWLFAWRDYAGKVGVEELQRLWGSVLAGEVKSPGKYSIRTLEFLKMLSKEEAELISSLAPYVVDSSIVRILGETKFGKNIIENKIKLDVLIRMESVGVLYGVDGIGLVASVLTENDAQYFKALHSFDKALLIRHENKTKAIKFVIYSLTDVGRQVLEIGEFKSNVDNLRLIGECVVSQGFSVELCSLRFTAKQEAVYYDCELMSV